MSNLDNYVRITVASQPVEPYLKVNQTDSEVKVNLIIPKQIAAYVICYSELDYLWNVFSDDGSGNGDQQHAGKSFAECLDFVSNIIYPLI